ncbi:nSTAND1 domain-containing NTPase [Nonomuraea cypriaca]|uniref:nSTAND1 domain-containing NTPase n=1 Tax=Nonomuraea cypriaca TaxID=1187855 RepID=UPI001A9C2854|nr:hypothetical protein [Nonomuraea cypriaca]
MARGELPLPRSDDPLTRFAADLRELRRRAGSPTYREMVKYAHYSLATLSGAASGQRLPSLPVTLAYVKVCGGDAAEWEKRWHAVAAELAAGGDPEPERHAPYVGLSAFRLEDADLFFGREHLLGELVERLRTDRLITLFGASGAGKSSLLRAGLLASWPHQSVIFTPGAHPLEECAVRLARLTGTPPGLVRAELAADPRALHLFARQVTVDAPGDLLVVVDQFEEVFTLCRDVAERTRFAESLVTAARAGDSRCHVVLGVRSDFHAHCTGHPVLRDELTSRLVVGPMTTGELRRAISAPASRAGCAVEQALLVDLVAHANGRAGVLPLLSHALLETWRRRRGNTLTLTGFQAAGGIDGALAHTAERVYADLEPARQRLARDLFHRLTALGEGTEDTKRRILRAELDTTDPGTEVVLERLAAQRLITMDGDTVELTHEALIRSWPRLHEWLSEDRDALRTHRRLTEAAQAWQELGRDESALYRGVRLATAREVAGRLSRLEREFLDASEAAEAEEAEAALRGTRRLHRLVTLLSVLLALAVAASAVAVGAQRQAAQERNTATSQRVAERAAASRLTDPALAARLSLAAYRLSANEVTRGSLLSAFGTPHATRLTGHGDDVVAVALSRDGRLAATASADATITLTDVTDPHHPRELATVNANARSAALSPDGRTLAAGGDGAVLLWDVADPSRPRRLPSLTGHAGAVGAVAFSPDGRTLAGADAGHLVRLWDLTRGGSATLSGHTGGVKSVAFSADGRTLASASADRTVRLWDLTSRTSAVLSGHTGGVNAVAFGGPVLASAGEDGTVRLWDLAGDPLSAADGHTDAVRALTFMGDALVSGGADASVRVWDVGDPREPRELATLAGHTGTVTSAAFAGRTLATAGSDHTTRLWDLPGDTLTGHHSSVYGAAFSPDGRSLATAGYDRAIRLWNLRDRTSEVLSGHTGPVNAVAYSPDGRMLASASADGTARLWDLRDHGSTVLAEHGDAVESVTFGGGTLATASSDKTAALWDIRTRTRLATLNGHTGPINDVVMTGRVVATASADHTVRLWDFRGRLLAVAARHTDAVKSVAFSPDGRLLASAGSDRVVVLWDVSDPARPAGVALLNGYTDAVKSVAFSPDGRTLATVSSDKTAVLWDVASRSRLATLIGHGKPVDAVAYAPDGHTLATAGEDWVAKLWETDPERVVARICATTASSPITPGEWSQYFPGMPAEPVCPDERIR